MTITVDDVNARVETDLPDTTIQLLIDAEIENVERRAGSSGSRTETKFASGTRRIVLSRKPDTIESITERRHILDEDSEVDTLTTNDYRVLGSSVLLRTGNGNNPAAYWGDEVVITYKPVIDEALRDRVVLDLVQLAIEFRAFKSEQTGEYEFDEGGQTGFDARREALLKQLKEPGLPVL